MANSETQPDQSLVASFSRAQSEMHTPIKNAVNPHFKNKYADLASIIEAVRPALNAEGIAFMQIVTNIDNAWFLSTKLLKGDEAIESLYPVNMSAKPQAVGSELTYAKRYSLSAMCGVAADDDDDGNAASASGNKPSIKQNNANQSSAEHFNWCMKVMKNAINNLQMTADTLKNFTDGKDFQAHFNALDSDQKTKINTALNDAMLMLHARSETVPPAPESHPADGAQQGQLDNALHQVQAAPPQHQEQWQA